MKKEFENDLSKVRKTFENLKVDMFKDVFCSSEELAKAFSTLYGSVLDTEEATKQFRKELGRLSEKKQKNSIIKEQNKNRVWKDFFITFLVVSVVITIIFLLIATN